MSLRSNPLMRIANLEFPCTWNSGLATQAGLARFDLFEETLN